MSHNKKITARPKQTASFEAELIHDPIAVECALNAMAKKINARLADKDPLVLCVMIGGLIPAGMLLPRLSFPLQVDYIHASRYRGATAGGTLHWLRKPQRSFTGRTLLLIDDILDEGITLAQIIDYCRQAGAKEVHTAVLVEKQLSDRQAPIKADFCELTVPDRYVFGYGMDHDEYHRNCDGIYALTRS